MIGGEGHPQIQPFVRRGHPDYANLPRRAPRIRYNTNYQKTKIAQIRPYKT